jgi:hypothetical protein
MSTVWELTDVELVGLWEKLFGERVPRPLIATARIRFADEFARAKRAAVEGVRGRYDDGLLDDVLTRVARADVRVVVHSADPRNPDDPRGRMRLLAARQGPVGVVIRQIPGETIWHSEGFVVTAGAGDALGRAVAASMPPSPAGRLPDVVVVPEREGDVDRHYGRAKVYDNYRELERRSDDWLRRPMSAYGIVETVQGRSIFGPRGITRRRIFWRDLIDDGRYAIRDLADHVAVGVDAPGLASMIDVDIAKALQTLEDERHA